MTWNETDLVFSTWIGPKALNNISFILDQVFQEPQYYVDWLTSEFNILGECETGGSSVSRMFSGCFSLMIWKRHAL